MTDRIGVLALQGAYQKHVKCLDALGAESRLVTRSDELPACSALIIPGGESTTMSLLMQEYSLFEPLKAFAETRPVMAICAGMILMADEVDDARVRPLGIIPYRALRNVYGSQLNSFTADIELCFDEEAYRAHFIRAPRFDQLSDDATIVATKDKDAVMVSYRRHLALSFHPELSDDARIHEYWLQQIIN